MSRIKGLLNKSKGIVLGLGGVLCATIITVTVVLYDGADKEATGNGTTNGKESVMSEEETTSYIEEVTTNINIVEKGTTLEGQSESLEKDDSTGESGEVPTENKSTNSQNESVTTAEKENITTEEKTTNKKSTETVTTLKPQEVQTTTKEKETQTTTKQQETTTRASEPEIKSVLEMSDAELLEVGKSLYKKYKTYAKEVLKYTNEVRAEAGVAPLVLDEQLCYVSFTRAYEMIYGNALGHTRPNGQPWSSLTVSAGIPILKLGENIAAGYFDAKEVVEKWKESERHYQNMINPDFTRMGAGYCYEDAFIYKNSWAQTLAK